MSCRGAVSRNLQHLLSTNCCPFSSHVFQLDAPSSQKGWTYPAERPICCDLYYILHACTARQLVFAWWAQCRFLTMARGTKYCRCLCRVGGWNTKQFLLWVNEQETLYTELLQPTSFLQLVHSVWPDSYGHWVLHCLGRKCVKKKEYHEFTLSTETSSRLNIQLSVGLWTLFPPPPTDTWQHGRWCVTVLNWTLL